jgi:hypothetical protein
MQICVISKARSMNNCQQLLKKSRSFQTGNSGIFALLLAFASFDVVFCGIIVASQINAF